MSNSLSYIFFSLNTSICCKMEGEILPSSLSFTTTWWLLLWPVFYFFFSSNFQSPLKHNDYVVFELSVSDRWRLWGEVKATLCMFLLNKACSLQKTSKGGWTSHQRIHRTTECFPGGGWDSAREGSKKSLDNYLQLWALLCHVVHIFFFYFYWGAGSNHYCYQIKSATVAWQWF